MRRTVVLGLLVVGVAAAGFGYVAVRDDGPDLDLAAISECRQPQVQDSPPHEELDLDLAARLEPVADLASPLAVDRWPDDRLVVALREGLVVLLDDDGSTEQILDISDRTDLIAEGGLLGIAVAPDDEHLYVHHTDLDGTSRLLAYALAPTAAGGGLGLDLESERELLSQPHPGLVHNGGHVVFGPDGYLYLGFGDGSLEVGRALESEARDTFAAKIVRIEPTPDADQPYAIPADNPDANGERGRPEIWMSGLRNPWRFSFDRETGELWIGDVGNDCWEEIDVAPDGASGLDFGWPRYEGEHALSTEEDDGASEWPIHTIEHRPACAIVGGYVYRGEAFPDLDGRYLYQDLCEGELRWIERTDDGGTIGGRLGIEQDFVLAFWEDEAGELFVLTAEDGLFRLVPDPDAVTTD